MQLIRGVKPDVSRARRSQSEARRKRRAGEMIGPTTQDGTGSTYRLRYAGTSAMVLQDLNTYYSICNLTLDG